MNKQTGNEYYVRLSNFERFILSKYGSSMNIDSFVKGLKDGKFDIYETLSDYCVYLQESNVHTSTLKQRVVTAKNFLFIDRVQNIDFVTDSINKIVVQLSNTFN
jgi:predicted AAA+ superfamily ATPase